MQSCVRCRVLLVAGYVAQCQIVSETQETVPVGEHTSLNDAMQAILYMDDMCFPNCRRLCTLSSIKYI